VRTAVYLTGALAIAVTLAACEPESITAARDTLGLGPRRTVSVEIPVTVDTFTVSEILTDWLGISTIAIADNLVAVEANPQTATLDVAGAVGTFTNVPLDSSLLQFAVEEEMQFTAAGLNLGEFRDAAEQVTLHAAPMALEVTNTVDAPLTLQDFTLGVVMVDPGTGNIRRVLGVPDYETDSLARRSWWTLPIPDSRRSPSAARASRSIRSRAPPSWIGWWTASWPAAR